MAHVTLTLEEYEALRSLIGSERESEGAIEAAAPAKKKRKKFGIQLKKLIKKHPRTKVTQLMSQAHRNTKKAMK